MRSFGSGSDILLGPGTFLTNGNDDGLATDGFFLQPGTRLRGSGRGVTTIKLAGLNFTECVHVAIASGAYGKNGGRLIDHDNITVEDLTIDLDAAGLGLAAPNDNVATYGIQLSGDNTTIRNVEVLHAYGLFGPFESFAISICAMTRSTTGALIENCSVRESAGDYVTAILLGGLPGLTASGVVANNFVGGVSWIAYSGGGTDSTVYSSNVAQDVGYGFRMDTGTFTNVVITGNAWSANKSAIQLAPQTPGAPVGDILITGNILRTNLDPVISFKSHNSARAADILVEGNILRAGSEDVTAVEIAADSKPFISNVTIHQNLTTLSSTVD